MLRVPSSSAVSGAGERRPAGGDHADQRELGGAGEHQQRQDAGLGDRQPGRDGDGAERHAVRAGGDARRRGCRGRCRRARAGPARSSGTRRPYGRPRRRVSAGAGPAPGAAVVEVVRRAGRRPGSPAPVPTSERRRPGASTMGEPDAGAEQTTRTTATTTMRWSRGSGANKVFPRSGPAGAARGARAGGPPWCPVAAAEIKGNSESGESVCSRTCLTGWCPSPSRSSSRWAASGAQPALGQEARAARRRWRPPRAPRA